jgi:hypothetical protein
VCVSIDKGKENSDNWKKEIKGMIPFFFLKILLHPFQIHTYIFTGSHMQQSTPRESNASHMYLVFASPSIFFPRFYVLNVQQ